jgi:hypothetical protein
VDLRLDTEYQFSEAEGDMTSFFVVYGVVKYQHLFSEKLVQTTFDIKSDWTVSSNGLLSIPSTTRIPRVARVRRITRCLAGSLAGVLRCAQDDNVGRLAWPGGEGAVA